MPLEDHVGFVLHKLGKVAMEMYSEQLDTIGLKPPHFILLAVLAEYEGVSQIELGQLMGVSPSGLVVFLDDLERLTAVERSRDHEDRRRHVLALTPNGHRLLAKANAISLKVGEDMLQGLDPEQRRRLGELVAEAAMGLGLVPQSRRG